MEELTAQGYDPVQVSLLKEEVILVDEDDNPIGGKDKYTSHLMEHINAGMLHRAFSVFLFNTEGKLLLHQRAGAKITFPLFWTNTCCSHPLYFEAELDPKDEMGVRRAAQRKLDHELGIKTSDMPPEIFAYLTRIQYKAAFDEKWGEHEIDYILFVQKDVEFAPNPNEIESVRWVTPDELRQLLADAKDAEKNVKVTPWFGKIAERFLFGWWDELLKNGRVSEAHFDHSTIHRL